jgi:hypothetical protein
MSHASTATCDDEPMTDTHGIDMAAPLEFNCPRCSHPASEAYYGPCTRCRREMRMRMGGEKREMDAVEYVPKMNVVPNQIASKE